MTENQPVDIVAARALANELDKYPGGYWRSDKPLAEIATTIRALCDEVEAQSPVVEAVTEWADVAADLARNGGDLQSMYAATDRVSKAERAYRTGQSRVEG